MAHPSSTSNPSFPLSALEELASLPLNNPDVLFSISSKLLATFNEALSSSTEMMLPSFTIALPTGAESGTAIAIDVGGSTLRVAAIYLRTRQASHSATTGEDPRQVLARKEWIVKDEVKRKCSVDFFDWIAERVDEVLREVHVDQSKKFMPVGVTWSFPIQQTGVSSGIVQKMGKGYMQWGEIHGTDLRMHFEAAFQRKNLRLYMTALLNDTEATLLSHSYANPATRISLIWGTGCNMALLLPLRAISGHKLGKRSIQWLAAATASEVGVMINTEISMFGRDVFPMSQYDRSLDEASEHPGFQPLEQLTSGRYLGEISRLAFIKGIEEGGLFQGRLPDSLGQRYSFDTGLMADMEAFHFDNSPSDQDITTVRSICRAISERAAIILAITIFTLWRLQRDSFLANNVGRSPDQKWEPPGKTIAVAFCGAVAERHPTVRERCQHALDILVRGEPNNTKSTARPRLVLEGALDSGLLGAAVAAVLNEEGSTRPIQGKL